MGIKSPVTGAGLEGRIVAARPEEDLLGRVVRDQCRMYCQLTIRINVMV